MLNETLSTACRMARLREKRVPELTGNSTLRFSTSIRTDELELRFVLAVMAWSE